MEKQAKTAPVWIDHQGNEIPVKYIPAHKKQADKVAKKLLRESEALSAKLEAFKELAFNQVDGVVDMMFRERSLEKTGKGNYTVYSFDKSIKIEISVNDVIDFDDHIQVAQAKINEFLEVKSQGADQDLVMLVNNAFKTTKGRLDKSRIFSLFQLKIKHPIWLEAMDLIKESISVNNTKRYVSIYKRNDSGQYKQIQLNFSAF